jgi:hypothetical protein
MKRRIGKNGVELSIEIQRLAIYQPGVEATRPRGIHQFGTGIGADHIAAGGQLFRQGTVTAAEIQDALSRTWGKQIDHRQAKIRDEPGIFRITASVPLLGWLSRR